MRRERSCWQFDEIGLDMLRFSLAFNALFPFYRLKMYPIFSLTSFS